jgi:hypothetical protein
MPPILRKKQKQLCEFTAESFYIIEENGNFSAKIQEAKVKSCAVAASRRSTGPLCRFRVYTCKMQRCSDGQYTKGEKKNTQKKNDQIK